MYLRLRQVYEFVKGDIHSRNMNEGEEVLKSGKIITVGCTDITNFTMNHSEKKITGLVKRTSVLKTFPHTVECLIKIENDEVVIKQLRCSCKAGLSDVCKHGVAVLLFLERNNIGSLEDLSCTDLRCVSSARKNDVLEEFAPVPARRLYRASQEIINDTREDVSGLFDRLCNLNSDSTIQLHKHDLCRALCCSTEKVFSISRIADIINNSLKSDLINEILSFPPLTLNQCCLSVINSLSVSDPIKLCYETGKSYTLWKEERKLRVTGSRIYSLFTYNKNAKPDWKKRSKDYFWPREFTNQYVRHGIEQEKFAREAYEKLRQCKVEQCGFVVHPMYPWAGYSPDGVVFGENGPELLLEVKCPYLGKTKTIRQCLDSCPFLDKGYDLKKKHPYYGQVQLGQLILNLKNCHLALYSSFDKSIHIVSVPFDKNFALEMLRSVRDTFMLKMIHYVCKEREQNDTGE